MLKPESSVSRVASCRRRHGYDRLMPIERRTVRMDSFNTGVALPYELRLNDFEIAMQDVYDFFYDVNLHLESKGLKRLEDMLRKAILSGTLSDMLTASLASHSRVLVENAYHNGHPDLLVQGEHPLDRAKSSDTGVEIKVTLKPGGAVDMHGARKQWLCVFVYQVDTDTEPARDRDALKFTEVYLGEVVADDFRKNDRGELGTRTATLDREGIAKLRQHWVYLDREVD